MNKQISFWENKHNIRSKISFSSKKELLNFMKNNNLKFSSNLNENPSISFYYFDIISKKVEKTKYFLVKNSLLSLKGLTDDKTALIENLINQSSKNGDIDIRNRLFFLLKIIIQI